MDPRKLLESLRERRITIVANGDHLIVPKDVLTDEDRQQIRACYEL